MTLYWVIFLSAVFVLVGVNLFARMYQNFLPVGVDGNRLLQEQLIHTRKKIKTLPIHT